MFMALVNHNIFSMNFAGRRSTLVRFALERQYEQSLGDGEPWTFLTVLRTARLIYVNQLNRFIGPRERLTSATRARTISMQKNLTPSVAQATVRMEAAKALGALAAGSIRREVTRNN